MKSYTVIHKGSEHLKVMDPWVFTELVRKMDGKVINTPQTSVPQIGSLIVNRGSLTELP